MFMANIGGLAVGMGIPMLVKYFDPTEVTDLSSNDHAWFMTMLIYGLIGLGLLLFCFTQCKEKVVMESNKDDHDVPPF